jgi:recombinational DNA repair protein RecR
MNKEEFNLNKPKNVKDVAKVLMGWIGGDCISTSNYIEDKKGLILILDIYNFEGNEPLKPLYHIIPNTPGNYETISSNQIKLNGLKYKIDKETKEAILSELNALN